MSLNSFTSISQLHLYEFWKATKMDNHFQILSYLATKFSLMRQFPINLNVYMFMVENGFHWIILK